VILTMDHRLPSDEESRGAGGKPVVAEEPLREDAIAATTSRPGGREAAFIDSERL
jgi:hypothetical protein